jgi:hypothetical protein
MAIYKVSDFVHLGIDVGVEKAEWRISLNADNTQIIIDEEIIGSHHDIEWETNMRLMYNPLDPGMNMETVNDGVGIYWNGDSPLYVSVRITMSGVPSQWYQKVWYPSTLTENGLLRRLSNPLDLERIPAYFSHNPRTLH